MVSHKTFRGAIFGGDSGHRIQRQEDFGLQAWELAARQR